MKINRNSVKKSKVLLDIGISLIIGLAFFFFTNILFFNIQNQIVSVASTLIGITAGALYLIRRYCSPKFYRNFKYNNKILIYFGCYRRLLKRTIGWGIIIGIIIAIFNFPQSVIFSNALMPKQYFVDPANGFFQVFIYLCIVVLFIPFIEEVYYRGLIFRIIEFNYNKGWGIILSSIIFMMMHKFDIGSFFIAIMLCLAYQRSKFLGASIVAHIIGNLAWYTAIYSKSISLNN